MGDQDPWTYLASLFNKVNNPGSSGNSSNIWGPPPPTASDTNTWGPPPTNATPGPPGPPTHNPWAQPQQAVDTDLWASRARTVMSQDPRFHVEHCSGASNGILMRIREDNDELDGGYRRFAAKVAHPGVALTINAEKGWIERLRSAKHVVDPLEIPDDPLSQGLQRRYGLPYIFMEYLEHDNMRQFTSRIAEAKRILPDGREVPLVLPNRLLWAILLCLIRACTGLAWPPVGPNSQPEVVGEAEPSRLAHNDLNEDNIMFGQLEPSVSEHARVPIVKLIDFGEAKEFGAGDLEPINVFQKARYDNVLKLEQYRPAPALRRNAGIDKNILDIGSVMARIIKGREFAFITDCRTFMLDPNVHPSLDADLRLLIQRCLAVDPMNRPRLEEMIAMADDEDSCFRRTERHYDDSNDDGLESDDTLEYIVSKYILDAKIG